MNKKILRVCVCSLIMVQSSAYATVTLVFNSPFVGGVSSNFATAAGTPSNGLTWGILVDNTGNGIASMYDDINYNLGSRQDLTTASGVATDDTLFISAELTSDTSAFLEGDLSTPGGVGGISSVTGVGLTGGVDAGDTFYVVWFDTTDPSNAGILSDASFLLPADGATETYDNPFVGNDSIRPADGSALTFKTVPEPSSTALLGLGGLALILRRRR